MVDRRRKSRVQGEAAKPAGSSGAHSLVKGPSAPLHGKHNKKCVSNVREYRIEDSWVNRGKPQLHTTKYNPKDVRYNTLHSIDKQRVTLHTARLTSHVCLRDAPARRCA